MHPESLYRILSNEANLPWNISEEVICNLVDKWLSQHTHESNKWDADYQAGFMDAIAVLRGNLK